MQLEIENVKVNVSLSRDHVDHLESIEPLSNSIQVLQLNKQAEHLMLTGNTDDAKIQLRKALHQIENRCLEPSLLIAGTQTNLGA
jgi:hypothetical protein